MLADCIRLAQTNNEALEALLQKFAPLIKKCGRQLHIEDGNEEMILAFIERSGRISFAKRQRDMVCRCLVE